MTNFKTSFLTQGQVKLSFVELMCKSLLWEGRIAQGIQIFLTLASYIQGVLLLLWGQIQMLPTENKEKVIADISNYLENVKIQAFLDQFFLEGTFGIVLGFLWFYFLILTATIGIIYWNQRSNQYIKSNLSCFITYLTQLHIFHSFWLINVILQYYFSVQSERATFFENSGSISNQAQSLVLLILNYLFAYMFAFFAYNPFAGLDFLSCHSNTFQILSITVKALLFLTLTIFSSDMPVQAWIFAVVSVVICSARYYKLLKSFPYYNYKAMKMHIICSSIEMVVVIVSFVGICLRSSNDNISFGVLAWADVLLLPFVVIFGISFVNRVAQQYSVLGNEVLKSEDAIVKKVFSLTCLIRNSKLSLNKAAHRGIFDIYFWGNKLNYSNKENLQKQQSFKTNLAPAFLMTPEDFSIDQMSEYYTTLIDSRINRTLKFGIQKLSQNNKLRAILAYRNINSSSPFILALLEMSKISQTQLNNRIIASKLYDKLQISLDEFFEEKKGKVLNLTGFLKLQTTSDIFTKMINSNTKKYVEFWSEYFKPRARIVALREKSIEIEKEADEINNFWTKYAETNKKTDKAFGISNHMIYALYISLTRAEAFEAFRITDKYRMISENQANNQSSKQVQVYEEQLNNEQVFVIYASMAKESLGRITYASQNVEDLLEWAPEQLIGQNIGVLLPDFLSQTHHQVLMNHAKEGFPVLKMMRNISTYIRDNRGHILHCDLRISIYPYVQASPIYVAAVRIDPVQSNNILLTKTGEIEGFTQNIGKILELSLEKKSYIQSLCQSNKEFEKINNFCECTAENAGREEKGQHESLKDTVSITMSKDYEKEDSSSIKVSSFMLRVHPLNRHTGSKQFDQKYQAFMSCQSLGNLSYFVLRLDSLSNKEDEEDSLYSEKEESEISEDLSEKKIIGGQTSIKVIEKSKTSQTVFHSKSISTFKEIRVSHIKHSTSIKVKAREIENKKKRDIADIDTMMSSSLGSSNRDRNNRLERVMMKIPKDKKLSIFNILIILFAVVSGILLTYFQLDNRQTLDLVQNSIETLSQTIFLCLRFTDFNAYTRIVWMIQDNIYRDNRYVEFGFDITSWDFFAVFVSIVATEINQRANNIRNFIDKLDPQLQTKFYEDRIPVWDASLINTLAEQPQYYNFFDLVAELSARGNRILPSGGPYDDRNPDVVFCANYTYNDLLLAGQQKIPLLIEDNQLKLNNQVILVGGMFGGLVALSLCILYLFFRIERDYIKIRNQFIAILSALDSNAIHNQLTQVKDFLHYLQMKESKDKKSVGKINQDKLFMLPFAKPEKVKGSHIPKRVFDNKGLNLAHIALFLSASTVFILLFSFAPILLGLTVNQKQQVLQKMNLLATSDNYSFRFVDLLNQIYTYGQLGGDTLTRNIPVREDFELNYEGLQYAQDFLLKEVLNPKYGLTEDPLLVEMITGSLCDAVENSDPIVTANCPYVQGGILEKGVIGLNSALLAALDETRRCFDSIERTEENIVNCFLVKGYLFIEIYYPFAFSAYTYIDTLIRSKISESIESSRDTIFILLFVYFGVSVVASSIIWFKTQMKLEKVIMGWRRMIKQIPHTVLSENRALRTFIMKNSDLN